jgi:tetratricopeptide (TPR) repeat protein
VVEQVQVWRGLASVRFALGQFGEAEAALRQVCRLAGAPLPTDALRLWSRIGQLAVTLVAGRLGFRLQAPPAGTPERTIANELHVALGLEELFVWTDQAELGLLCALWEMSLDDRLSTEPRRTYHSSGLFFMLSHTPLRGLCRRYLQRNEGRIASGTHTEINFLRVRALVEINHNEYVSAARYAAQAVALARKYKDDLSLLHSLLQLQIAMAGLDDFAQMLAASQEMEVLAARADNPRYLTMAFIGQGAAMLNLGDYAAGAALLEKARAYLPQELGPIPESLALGLAAACARHRQKFEQAELLADQALGAVRRARWPLVQLRYPLLCILDVYLQGERVERHIEKIEEALVRLHQLARLFPQAVPVDEMFHGLYYWRSGQADRALKAFRKSIQAADRLRLRPDKAQAQYWFGCFAQSRAGRGLVREGALPHLRAALATFQLLSMAGAARYVREALESGAAPGAVAP